MLTQKIIDRFMQYVQKNGENECWPWLSQKNRVGRGIFYLDALTIVQAHRLMLEIIGEPVDKSVDVLHLCDNLACVNPKHLEPQITETRFWKFVDKNGEGDCWNWIGTKRGQGGYGNFVIMGRANSAHRISYKMHKGDIPVGMMVLHNCNNKTCVNPDHLRLGTAVENAQDMILAGVDTRGEHNGNSILTEEKVREMKKLFQARKLKNREIASMFGVSLSTVKDIRRGKTWFWVD